MSDPELPVLTETETESGDVVGPDGVSGNVINGEVIKGIGGLDLP